MLGITVIILDTVEENIRQLGGTATKNDSKYKSTEEENNLK